MLYFRHRPSPPRNGAVTCGRPGDPDPELALDPRAHILAEKEVIPDAWLDTRRFDAGLEGAGPPGRIIRRIPEPCSGRGVAIWSRRPHPPAAPPFATRERVVIGGPVRRLTTAASSRLGRFLAATAVSMYGDWMTTVAVVVALY